MINKLKIDTAESFAGSSQDTGSPGQILLQDSGTEATLNQLTTDAAELGEKLLEIEMEERRDVALLSSGLVKAVENAIWNKGQSLNFFLSRSVPGLCYIEGKAM